MSTSYINNEPYLRKDRVVNLAYPELVECSLCRGIVWLPKVCNDCETPYCSLCIKTRQAEKTEPIQCPVPCSGFSECTCPGAVLFILNTFEVKCRYTLYGCNEILRYNNLETHEEVCGYRQITCDGCRKEIAKKDFQKHDSTCVLVLLTCSECNTIYKRQDETKHTETKCLREQLIQQKEKLKQLENSVKNLTEMLKQSSILPNISEVTE